MPRTARPPKQIRRLREAILDASIAVFARRGYQAATMHELAREAGYTAPSLYNYFAGKQQIFEALVDRLDAEFIAVFDEAEPEVGDFAGSVERLIRRQVDLVQRRRGAFQIFLAVQGGAGAIPSARAARRHAEGFRTYMERFAGWMAKAAAGTDVAGRDPEELAYALWGLSIAFQARGARSGEADTQAMLGLFLRGALGAAAPRAKALQRAPAKRAAR
jgi:TetR/AcrR family transcriptional regulator of autoinduction and epiphytic fitness